jgi:protoporphyrinogen oxidase
MHQKLLVKKQFRIINAMNQERSIDYLIIGGGPTGLGAACRLHELSVDWHLLEATSAFGGLSSSFIDSHGFTWDFGGHVLFSHYETFDRYMRRAIVHDGWLSHQRESWIWIRNRFVPYPLQNNLHRLPPNDRWECVQGLLSVQDSVSTCKPPMNFADWMRTTMGGGITEHFLYPYNQKVWAYPPEKMSFDWISERVAIPTLERALKSICTERDDVSWGPNQQFLFPKRGGTGSIWENLGAQLPAHQISRDCRIIHIDVHARIAYSSDNRKWHFKRIISSIPLNQLIAIAPGVIDLSIASNLLFSSTHIIGLGIEGQPPDHLRSKCWMYFPETNSPYYRVTVFSNYSPNNVSVPHQQWSLMAEVSESPEKPVNIASISSDTIRALHEDGLLSKGDEISSITVRTIPQGYPTPFLGRDSLVDPILRQFEQVGIFSRGRFGAWKYEVGNQDHSFAQGYECATRLACEGSKDCESTLFTPNLVNSKRNP